VWLLVLSQTTCYCCEWVVKQIDLSHCCIVEVYVNLFAGKQKYLNSVTVKLLQVLIYCCFSLKSHIPYIELCKTGL